MTTPRTLLASMIGMLALTQAGCAALGVAMIATTPGTKIDTAQILDPTAVTVGAPTEPGNANLTLKITLPEYQGQYVTGDVTQVLVGLADLESKVPYFGYEGSVKKVSDYHAALSDLLFDPTEVTLPGVAIDESSVGRKDASRYLYAKLSGKNAYTVTFTNVRKDKKLVAFAAAFSENATDKARIIGFVVRNTPVTVTPPTTNLGTLSITLGRGLVDLGGNVTIIEKPPAASLN